MYRSHAAVPGPGAAGGFAACGPTPAWGPVRLCFVLLLLWLPAVACEPGAGDGERPEDARFPDLAFSLRSVIGGADAEGPAAFGRVSGVAMHEDRLLAVVDGMSQEVHLFDLEGAYLESLAGDGTGPGMARRIQFISYGPDGGLCIWDWLLQRVTRFRPDGTGLETWSPDYDAHSMLRSRLLGLAGDCSVAVFRDRIRSEIWRQTGAPALLQLTDTVAYTAVGQGEPARELYRRTVPPVWLVRSEQMTAVHDAILAARPEEAVAGSVLWFGISDSLRWRRVTLDGEELSPVRLPTNRRSASAQDVEHSRAQMKQDAPWQGDLVTEAQAQEFVDVYREGIDKLPASGFFPAYDAMIGGSDGTLWIREPSSFSDETSSWFLLDPDGSVIGQLALPVGGEPVAGSSSVLVMKHTDEWDAEYLRVYEIKGSPPEG